MSSRSTASPTLSNANDKSRKYHPGFAFNFFQREQLPTSRWLIFASKNNHWFRYFTIMTSYLLNSIRAMSAIRQTETLANLDISVILLLVFFDASKQTTDKQLSSALASADLKLVGRVESRDRSSSRGVPIITWGFETYHAQGRTRKIFR